MALIEIADDVVDEIVYNHILDTFHAFLTPTDDIAILQLSVDQMDNILAGAMNYAKWCCSPQQNEMIRDLWLMWASRKSILESD